MGWRMDLRIQSGWGKQVCTFKLNSLLSLLLLCPEELYKYPSNAFVPSMLAMSQSDPTTGRIEQSSGCKMSERLGAAGYVETSAVTGDGVHELLESIAQVVVKKRSAGHRRCLLM